MKGRCLNGLLVVVAQFVPDILLLDLKGFANNISMETVCCWQKQYVSSFLALHDAYILRDWHVPFVHHVDKKNNSYAGIEHKYESINVSARAAAGLRLAHLLQPLLNLLLKTSGYPRFPRPLFTLAGNSLTKREPHSATTWRRLQTLRGSMDLRASQSINLALPMSA